MRFAEGIWAAVMAVLFGAAAVVGYLWVDFLLEAGFFHGWKVYLQ